MDTLPDPALIEGGVLSLRDGRRIGLPRQVRYVRPSPGLDIHEEVTRWWALVPAVPVAFNSFCWAMCVMLLPWHEQPTPVQDGNLLSGILEEAYPADLGEWALEIRPPKWKFHWIRLSPGPKPPITEHQVDRHSIDLLTLDWIEQSDAVSECIYMPHIGHIVVCLVGVARDELFKIAHHVAGLCSSIELYVYSGPPTDMHPSVIRLRFKRGIVWPRVSDWARYFTRPRIGLKRRQHRRDEIRKVVDAVARFLPVEGLPELVQLYADSDVLLVTNYRRHGP